MIRIVFSLPMVRALRAGLKTQTRRVSPPRFKVGDVLGVAEPCTISLREIQSHHTFLRCDYAAGGALTWTNEDEVERCRTMPTVINRTPRSGRFMPDWAVRTKVRIAAVEEQRLGDITEADAIAEGFTDRAAFLNYFGTLHPGPADLTLPVWAIHFEVIS